MTQIRDPLYGYLELSENEKSIVDTSQFQRLRRIRQLGLSFLVYPGATHTRFEHSLGVSHLAERFGETLELDERRREELKVAALLHDTGHGPFSHTSERVARRHGRSHEDYSSRVIEELEDQHDLEPERLKHIIRGELELGKVVAGDIDADRMDYLMRDSHATGLEHGSIDYETVIRCASIDSRRLVYDSKALEALESLFTSRFHMLKTLYKHHTVDIAERMMERALQDLCRDMDVDTMMKMDSYQAHAALLNSEGPSEYLYRRVKDRKLFKRCKVLGKQELGKEALKELERRFEPGELEREIAEEAELEEADVIVDLPRTPEAQDFNVLLKHQGGIVEMSELSPIPGALSEAEWRQVDLRVYGPREHREKLKQTAERVLPEYSGVLRRYL